ncbi:MAG: transporter substrate-binding domain-containing protein, partial [Ancalomicrobiaceae bacterium]|nr:transporter substrate-binding domain-containing protein [Ancalomicrobiaceae bacterium]
MWLEVDRGRRGTASRLGKMAPPDPGTVAMMIPVNRLVVKMGFRPISHILLCDYVRVARTTRRAGRATIVGSLIASLAMGLMLVSLRALAADETPPPEPPRADRVVPSFWDPQVRPEKPPGDAGTIRFLTSGDFPPFNFLDSGGHLTGFNVDLARAICTVLSATCT